MTSFSPGQSPPHVTIAHLNFFGSKYIFFLGPASSKEGGSFPSLIILITVLCATLTITLFVSGMKLLLCMPVTPPRIGDGILASPKVSIFVSTESHSIYNLNMFVRYIPRKAFFAKRPSNSLEYQVSNWLAIRRLIPMSGMAYRKNRH